MTGGDPRLHCEALADDAWLLRFGDRMDDATTARVHAAAAHLRELSPPWLRDLVPAYTSLGVFFDLHSDPGEIRDWLLQRLSLLDTAPTGRSDADRTVEIPVAYGGDFGPDLAPAANELELTPEELADRHASGHYTVAMIGFAPGFPYLSGLDDALALPRLATPRTRVASGSVGIGGSQTGIYPRDSAGGWRLLGRTPLRLFDPRRDEPSLLSPGDRVRFRAIDADEFARLSEHDA